MEPSDQSYFGGLPDYHLNTSAEPFITTTTSVDAVSSSSNSNSDDDSHSEKEDEAVKLRSTSTERPISAITAPSTQQIQRAQPTLEKRKIEEHKESSDSLNIRLESLRSKSSSLVSVSEPVHGSHSNSSSPYSSGWDLTNRLTLNQFNENNTIANTISNIKEIDRKRGSSLLDTRHTVGVKEETMSSTGMEIDGSGSVDSSNGEQDDDQKDDVVDVDSATEHDDRFGDMEVNQRRIRLSYNNDNDNDNDDDVVILKHQPSNRQRTNVVENKIRSSKDSLQSSEKSSKKSKKRMDSKSLNKSVEGKESKVMKKAVETVTKKSDTVVNISKAKKPASVIATVSAVSVRSISNPSGSKSNAVSVVPRKHHMISAANTSDVLETTRQQTTTATTTNTPRSAQSKQQPSPQNRITSFPIANNVSIVSKVNSIDSLSPKQHSDDKFESLSSRIIRIPVSIRCVLIDGMV